MNQARMQSKLANLANSERKVFEVVPIADSWTSQQVLTEYQRNHGTSMAVNNIERCLHNLADTGLIRKYGVGTNSRFQRAEVVAQPGQVARVETPAGPAAEPAPSPLDVLYALAERARRLSEELDSLTQDMETAILATEERLKQRDDEKVKLAQFKKLLSELTV